MAKRLTIDAPAWQVWVGASALVLTGALVASGIGYAGYAYGRETAPQLVATPTERVYTPDDLRAAATACGAAADVVSGDTLTMLGANFAGYTRQCVVAEIDAPSRAVAEFGNITARPGLEIDGGEYSWSNVTMTWKQTEIGRDLTIKVGRS